MSRYLQDPVYTKFMKSLLLNATTDLVLKCPHLMKQWFNSIKKRIILVYVVDGETWAVCTWDWAGHEATYGIVLWFRFKRTSVYFDLLFMETWENQNSKSERTGLFCLYCITAKRGFKHVQCFCAAVHTCSQKSLYNSSSSNSAFPKGRRSISHPTAQADDLFAFSTAVRREFEVELSVCLIYLKVEQEESETTSPLNSQWLGSSIPSIIHLADFYKNHTGL